MMLRVPFSTFLLLSLFPPQTPEVEVKQACVNSPTISSKNSGNIFTDAGVKTQTHIRSIFDECLNVSVTFNFTYEIIFTELFKVNLHSVNYFLLIYRESYYL